MGNVLPRHLLTVFDGQALYEHAPYPLGLVTHPAHPVHLERHQPGIHLEEQPFPDTQDDIWSVNRVVNRQDQRCTVLRDAQVPVSVLLRADRQ